MQTVLTAYAEQGIKLAIESKRVKHINFRIKSIDEAPFTSLLSVSYPMRMPQHLLMQSLEHRLAWAIDCQQKQRKLKQLKPCLLYTSPSPRDQRGSRMPSSA